MFHFLANLLGHKSPPPAKPPAPTTFTNGMAVQPGANGLVWLEVVEAKRAACEAVKMTLPHLWAIEDAANDPALGLSDADKFNVLSNCNYARTFLGPLGAASKGWCPAVFVDTVDPTGHKMFNQGDGVPDAGSFASDFPQVGFTGVHVKDVGTILDAAIEFWTAHPST